MAVQMHAWPATKFIGGSLTLCGADRKCLGNEAPSRATVCGSHGFQGPKGCVDSMTSYSGTHCLSAATTTEQARSMNRCPSSSACAVLVPQLCMCKLSWGHHPVPCSPLLWESIGAALFRKHDLWLRAATQCLSQLCCNAKAEAAEKHLRDGEGFQDGLHSFRPVSLVTPQPQMKEREVDSGISCQLPQGSLPSYCASGSQQSNKGEVW